MPPSELTNASDWLTVLHARVQPRFHVFLMIAKGVLASCRSVLACLGLRARQAFREVNRFKCQAGARLTGIESYETQWYNKADDSLS